MARGWDSRRRSGVQAGTSFRCCRPEPAGRARPATGSHDPRYQQYPLVLHGAPRRTLGSDRLWEERPLLWALRPCRRAATGTGPPGRKLRRPCLCTARACARHRGGCARTPSSRPAPVPPVCECRVCRVRRGAKKHSRLMFKRRTPPTTTYCGWWSEGNIPLRMAWTKRRMGRCTIEPRCRHWLLSSKRFPPELRRHALSCVKHHPPAHGICEDDRGTAVSPGW